jgi:dihydroneopterin aldolase/2-amino-4-hydroxy-6-hydroxymethyldihydropteridine diphosphokinase
VPVDSISIVNLEIFAKHGVLPEENALGQKFLISAELFLDLREAGKTDDLAKSVDYCGICRDVKRFAEGNTFMLIETLAERIAEHLLVGYPPVRLLRLEVKKPWAPVGAHIDTVSVAIERGRHVAFVALGSNVGDRVGYLNFALDKLGAATGCRVLRVSNFINTKPYGCESQGDYLNGCVELETLASPTELRALLKGVEDETGRERGVRWGPRTLDLDIIYYDDLVYDDGTLRIPHIDMHKRDFVLLPLAEIAPYKLHPVYVKTAAELLELVRDDARTCSGNSCEPVATQGVEAGSESVAAWGVADADCLPTKPRRANGGER